MLTVAGEAEAGGGKEEGEEEEEEEEEDALTCVVDGAKAALPV